MKAEDNKTVSTTTTSDSSNRKSPDQTDTLVVALNSASSFALSPIVITLAFIIFMYLFAGIFFTAVEPNDTKQIFINNCFWFWVHLISILILLRFFGII